ncbi:hypothetical protein IJG66_00650 [Candidatus Saccharibacteria bacterium]|nr:hypothetical protein [Candidatus Saccharibacteria bacterium]
MKIRKINSFKLAAVGSGSLLILTLMALVMTPTMMPGSSSAAGSATATITVNIPDNIAIELSKTALNIDLGITGGTDAFGSDNTIVDVSTNNYTGYTLSMTDNDTTPTGNTALIRQKNEASEADSTIPTIESDIEGGYTSDTMTASHWGYSLASATTGYKAVPALGATNVIKTTDSASSSDTTPVFFGVKAASSLMPGTYKSTVIFTAVANYQPDKNNAITNISPASIAVDGGEELTIDTNIDYSDNLVDATHPLNVLLVKVGSNPETTVSCGSVALANNSDKLRITCTTPTTGLEEDEAYTVRLVFTKLGDLAYDSSSSIIAEASGFWGITYMQDMTSEICSELYTPSNATGGSVTIITDKATYNSTVTADGQPYVPQRTLIDVRGKDGTGTIANPATGSNQATYVVRKLADGHCWMVQNLDMTFGATSSSSSAETQSALTLTNATTDIGYGTDSAGAATGRTSWTPDYKTQTASGIAWAQYGTDGAKSFDHGNKWWDGSSTLTTTQPSDATQAAVYHVGNYYNWNAATAGSGYTGSTESYSQKYTTSNQYAADSICPKGWKLPLGLNENTTDGSFNYLIRNKYNISVTNSDASVIINPMSFIRSGYYSYNGSLNAQGTSGGFWSSTVNNSNNARGLNFSSSNLNPQGRNSKGYGFSIRCMAR